MYWIFSGSFLDNFESIFFIKSWEVGSKLCIVGGYTTINYSQNKLNCGIFGEHVELWGPYF